MVRPVHKALAEIIAKNLGLEKNDAFCSIFGAYVAEIVELKDRVGSLDLAPWTVLAALIQEHPNFRCTGESLVLKMK